MDRIPRHGPVFTAARGRPAGGRTTDSSSKDPAAPPPDARIPPVRRALYALLTLLLFVALVEGALALAGLGDRAGRLSLSRGFSPAASYLVPDETRPGWWHTQMNGGEAPEIEIPPKGSALRVLMFGGSNTAGFQTEHIDTALDEQLPDPGFEVINLGRAGYGTERVLILLRQAMVLEPDLVLIYSGHNEFVEGGFALELAQGGLSPLTTRVADALLGLRSVCLAVDVLERRVEASRGPILPEARRPRSKVFRDMTPERAEIFYDVYRKNLTAMIETCRQADVPVLFSTVLGNLFDPPYVTNPPESFSASQRRALQAARSKLVALLPSRIRDALLPPSADMPSPRLRPDDWGSNLKPAQLAERRARPGPRPEPPPLRPHTGLLAAAPFWSKPDTWTDRVFDLMEVFQQLHERRLSPEERAALQTAPAIAEEALALCPDDPETLYALGLCVYLLGDDDARAAQLLHAAAAADRAPTKGNDRINGIVRELAAGYAGDPDVRFLDMERLFESLCPQNLPGYEVLLDNCHLHPAARLILIEQFVPDLLELGRRVLERR